MEVPILYFNVDGSQVFHHDLLKELFEKVGSRTFAVVSVNGMRKTGKSFLITELLRVHFPDLPAVEWSQTEHESDVGIWAWPNPLQFHDPSGQERCLILLKTKTSLEHPATLYQNAIVSALSLSLSSLFIFNLRKAITKDNLAFLQYFLNLAKCYGDSNPSFKVQRILFLVRDMELRVKDFAHGYHSPTTKPPPTAHSQTNLFTQIFNIDPTRQPLEVQHTYRQVTSSFEDLGLFALPERTTSLSLSLVHQSERTLELEFQNYAHALVDLLVGNDHGLVQLEGKRFQDGSDMTGYNFLEVIDLWNRRLRQRPTSVNKELSRAEMLNKIATTNLLSLYISTITDFMLEQGRRTGKSGMYSKTLAEKMNSFLKICLDTFSRRLSQGDDDLKTRYRETLSVEIELKMKLFESLNESRLKYAREVLTLKNEANDIFQKLQTIRAQREAESELENQEEFERSLNSVQELHLRKQSEDFERKLLRIHQDIEETQCENQINLDQIVTLINNISEVY